MKKYFINTNFKKLVICKLSGLNFGYKFLFLLAIMLNVGCKKFIEIGSPKTSINSENVYASDETAIASLTGIYAKMSSDNQTMSGLSMISIYPGLSSDEFGLYQNGGSNEAILSYKNALNSTTNPNIWSSCYAYIYNANAALEGLNNSTKLTPKIKSQLMGEAYFVRAFCYFYLVNLYGDVPLVTSTDYSKTSTLARSSKTEVTNFMIDDLLKAQLLLSPDYLMGDLLTPYPVGQTERVRPNRYTVNSLLARVYLYRGDYLNAESQASKVISNTVMYDTVSVDKVFLMNNSETIWALQPVGADNKVNTGDGGFFIPNTTTFPNNSYPVYISDDLLANFESGDKRFSNWLFGVLNNGKTYYYPFKYKIRRRFVPTSEYSIIFRLAEQYLIRAEARARQNNLSGGLKDLNLIRQRAALPVSNATTQTQLLDAIAKEKRIELFSEWGHRWLDLKRTGKVDGVMTLITPLKGGAWNSAQALYPIPLAEVQQDPNLVQNPGYN